MSFISAFWIRMRRLLFAAGDSTGGRFRLGIGPDPFQDHWVSLIRIKPTSGASRPTFAYDYQGRRFEKTFEEYDDQLTSMQTVSKERFVYDGWNLIFEISNPESQIETTKSFPWGQDLSGSMQGAGGVGGLLSVLDESSSDVFYPTYDANGNVSEYLDETGAVAAHYEYSAFGRVIASTGSPDDFAFRFSTKYQDNETTLLYYGFRYYDPQTGRWVNRDPIGEYGGLNRYAFVGNDGVNRWDLLGELRNDPMGPLEELFPKESKKLEIVKKGIEEPLGSSKNKAAQKAMREILEDAGDEARKKATKVLVKFVASNEHLYPRGSIHDFMGPIMAAGIEKYCAELYADCLACMCDTERVMRGECDALCEAARNCLEIAGEAADAFN
ncbi:MAG: RHS repeat domain-containing protein [Puniceicoccales bacterium]